MGFSARGRRNVLWHDRVGVFVYTHGHRIVVEDLDCRSQQYLTEHTEEISTLAIQVRLASFFADGLARVVNNRERKIASTHI